MDNLCNPENGASYCSNYSLMHPTPLHYYTRTLNAHYDIMHAARQRKTAKAQPFAG